jgi:two-component system sensor histidine kinase KdpD
VPTNVTAASEPEAVDHPRGLRVPVLAGQAKSPRIGLMVAILAVAITTLAIYPLKEVAPAVSAGVVYLLPVLMVSIFWNVWIGLFTAVLSTVSFNFFHIEPTGMLTISSPENLVALAVFLMAAVITSTLAEVSRAQALEADRRRLEADIAADMARILLGGAGTSEALPEASSRLAEEVGFEWARLSLDSPDGESEHELPLRLGSGRTGRLELPPNADPQSMVWVRERIAPGIEAVLRAAIERDKLQDEAIESRALRRSDVLKTALIRSVSHDLRSPLAGIVTSGEALNSKGLTDAERTEMSEAVVTEASRLARLVDNLLDLSRLESGAAGPRPDWCAIDEVIETAIEQARRIHPGAPVRITTEDDVGMFRIDANQVERALENLIENAQRYSAPEPVTVSLRGDRGAAVVRIVDRGPGIEESDLERIFDPFVRLSESDGHQGSGLGLAIAKGFIEANGGRVHAESLPGQGSAFVIEIPAESEIDEEPVRG